MLKPHVVHPAWIYVHSSVQCVYNPDLSSFQPRILYPCPSNQDVDFTALDQPYDILRIKPAIHIQYQRPENYDKFPRTASILGVHKHHSFSLQVLSQNPGQDSCITICGCPQ